MGTAPNEQAQPYSSPALPIAEFGFSKGLEERYELGEQVGKGASSIVYAAVDKKTGVRVAVKAMQKQWQAGGDWTLMDPSFVQRVRNEVDILGHLGRSLNVCYYYGAYECEEYVYLVMELCSGGQLWDRVLQGKYTERDAARLVKEALRTVAQCHSKHVMIRDIKPQNFMFSGPEESAVLKAVDFGVAVFCKPGQVLKQRTGTRIMMAPEVVLHSYTLSADMWSMGIMAYLLLTGRLPYPFWDKLNSRDSKEVTTQVVYRDILQAPLDFTAPPWDTLSAEAHEFVKALLHRDAKRRPTAEQALQHRWLQDELDGVDIPLSNSIVQRLQRFGTYGRLKQVALRAVANVLPHDSLVLADLRGLFTELDPADSGRVPYAKLQAELVEGGFQLSASETHQLLGQIDIDQSGEITFDKFLAALMDWSKLQESPGWDALVKRAFEALDEERCGQIGPEDLELLLCGAQGCEAPDVLASALREVGVAAGGGIGLPEFRRLLAAELRDNLNLFETRLWAKGGGCEASSTGASILGAATASRDPGDASGSGSGTGPGAGVASVDAAAA